MKRPFLTQTHWSVKAKYFLIASLFLVLPLKNVLAQTCATLVNLPTFVCSGSQSTALINGYDAANNYTFLFSSGSATVNTSGLPFVTFTWTTTGNIGVVMVETPLIGTCTNDTLGVFVSSSAAPSPACNDTINFSLDEFCLGEVTADLVMEGIYNYDEYEIIIRDPITGLIIPSLNKNHIGKFLEVRARHICSGNFCWGVLRVEDKLPPAIRCSTYIVDCTDTITPQVLGFPKPNPLAPDPIPAGVRRFTSTSSYYDNCGSTVFTYNDVTKHVNCPPATLYIDTVFRTWIVTDNYFNADTCVDTILIRAASLLTFTCPPSYDGITLPHLDCDDNFKKDANGNPHPDVTGYPFGVACRNLNYSYSDLRLRVCENTYKILREWVLIDWCTGTDTTCIQIIKVVDDEAPIVVCQPNQTVSTLPNSCTGQAWVNLPKLIDDCSDASAISWSVEVKRGVPGPIVVPSTIIATKDGIFWDPIRKQYLIKDLPVGWSWVFFTATDECGNTMATPCPHDIFVIETTKPIAVCDLQTTVTLSDEGSAKVYAMTFDDGSHDNCELDSFKVRRMDNGNCPSPIVSDTLFRNYVEFCCADVGKTILIVLQVTDKAGNTNECMVEITVQDKQPPVVICLPSPITVSCEFNRSNLSVFGVYRTAEADRKQIRLNDPSAPGPQPRLWGRDGLVIEDCNLHIDSSIVFNIHPICGTGTIIRTYIFSDDNPQNDTIVCQQVIHVVDYTPLLLSQIVWPRDTTFIGCLSNTSPAATGSPSWPTNLTCSDIKTAYDDKVFDIIDNACYKILRTWTVIDWCRFDPNTGVGRWNKIQVIKVINNTAPTFTSSCSNRIFDGGLVDCGGNAILIATATDDCTPENELKYSYKIDLNNNSSIDFSGSGNNASGAYPGGTHRITFLVEDQCGNEATCTFLFSFTDIKQPTPFCRTGLITVIMPSSGRVTVKASDFNTKSFDNCTADDRLRFTFSPSLFDTENTYDCPANGKADTFSIRIYVTDLAGNQDYCDTKIIIQDGIDNHCPDNVIGGGGISQANVGGSIFNESNKMLESTEITINGNTPAMPKTYLTTVDGHYTFNSLPVKESYILSANKDDDPLNGLTTQDIVMIQKHILGLAPLTSPYKVIAADANNTESVTARDIVEIRKMILGINTTFPNNKSWRFVNSRQQFSDISHPWPIEEEGKIQNLSDDEMENNFIAVKIGDVSGNARTSNATNVTSRQQNVVKLRVRNDKFEINQKIIIPVNLSEKLTITGFQMELNFDPTLIRFVNIVSPSMLLTDQHINFSDVREGRIKISYDNAHGISVSDDFMNLQFEALASGEMANALVLVNREMNAEWYDQNGESGSLELEFRNGEVTQSNGFYLFQNLPNPFKNTTSISFQLPKEQWADIKIFDVNGQIVKVISNFYKAGFNTVDVSKTDIKTTGILYYQLETAQHRAVRKMLLIE